jgi:hypothetical protein
MISRVAQRYRTLTPVYIAALYMAALAMSILSPLDLLPGVRSMCVLFPFLAFTMERSCL